LSSCGGRGRSDPLGKAVLGISVDGEKMGFPISGFCPRQPDPVNIYRRRSSSSFFIFGEDGEEFVELVSKVFSSSGSEYIPTFPTVVLSPRSHPCGFVVVLHAIQPDRQAPHCAGFGVCSDHCHPFAQAKRAASTSLGRQSVCPGKIEAISIFALFSSSAISLHLRTNEPYPPDDGL